MNTKETNPPAGVTTLDRFEAWFKANHHARLDRKMADGSYNDPTAHAMWQAWQAGSIDVAKAVNAQQAERDALRAELDAIDAAEPVAYRWVWKSKPHDIEGWCYTSTPPNSPELQEIEKLFTRPMPPQIVGLQDVHDAVTADPTLADCSQDVNAELVEALQLFADALPLERSTVKTCYAVTNQMRDSVHAALSKYKGAK